MPELHSDSFNGTGQAFVSICSLYQTPIGFDYDMVTKAEEKGE